MCKDFISFAHITIFTLSSKKPMTFESAKAAESTAELRRAKEKLTEYEDKLSKIEKEKNGLNVKVRELESLAIEKKASGTSGNFDLKQIKNKKNPFFYQAKL